MDIKDAYLHGTVGVVKSINVEADKLKYILADKVNTPIEVTMPLATTTANGLLSSTDKNKIDLFNLSTVYNGLFMYKYSTSGSFSREKNKKYYIRIQKTGYNQFDKIIIKLSGLTNPNSSMDQLITLERAGYASGLIYTCRGINIVNPSRIFYYAASPLDICLEIKELTGDADYSLNYTVYANIDTLSISVLNETDYQNATFATQGYWYDVSDIATWYFLRAGVTTSIGNGITTNTLRGTLDGDYVQSLTGYTKPTTTLSALSASDTLNQALGKLELKADLGTTAYDWYLSVTKEDTDELINKWGEIVDFLDSVKEGTDITNEFVTVKTDLTITGLKTFESDSDDTGVSLILKNKGWKGNMSTAMDFYNGSDYKVPNARIETKMVGSGKNGGTLIFYTQTAHASTNPNPNGLTERFRLGDNGTATLSGAFMVTSDVTAKSFITDGGTASQFVKGDGTLDSNTYALASTFGSYLPLAGGTMTGTIDSLHINPKSNNTYSLGNQNYKWVNLYSANIYSDTIYNGSSIYASGNEIIHGGSDYFELNKGYPDTIIWMNAKEYKLKLGSKGVQFMIAANGNVGIGDVGGAPSYKLHIGGGDLMADTVHAWSGGFKKNGSSNDYVLLGGGGHKALTDLFTSLGSDSTDIIAITIGGTTKTITKDTLATNLGLGNNAYTSTAYLPLAGGQMNDSAYISWNTGTDGNDVSDWSTITENGLRIISSTSKTSKAPKQYSTALHVRGRYGFLLASEGGATANSFYIGNLGNRKENRELNWFLLLHSGNYSSYLPLLNSASTHATNESVIYAPSTAGNAGQVLISNGTGAPSWGDYSVKNVSKKIDAAGAGWYRIATSILGISNCLGTFEILGSRSNYHTSAKIVTGTSYGNTVSLNVIDCLNYANAALTKVRIVYHTTWSGNYAYLEVYKVALEDVTISAKSVNGFGWTLIDPIAGSVPSGYSTLERSLTSNVLQTDGILAVAASFSGSVTLTGTAADTSVLKFSREGANTLNYILWPGNTNQDCKLAFGYSNSSAGVYYYMTSKALYPAANNTYDLGTTTNAWKTIYGTVTNVDGVAATANEARHVWFSDSVTESKRVYDNDFKYNPYTNLLTVGSISGSAAHLTTTEIVSSKTFNGLTNSSWADTDYTFTDLESGTYAILVTSNNLVASGIMSVYKNITDSVGDEIPLHVYGTAGWRPYLRTSAKKLLISSNDVTAASNGRTVTIKIAKIL